MTTKHTPGPWDIVPISAGLKIMPLDPDKFTPYNMIAEITYSQSSMANARLIASAPELLEALKAFMGTVCFGAMGSIKDGPYYLLHGNDPIVVAMKKAIAKAEGR